jgi:two-component system NtrC family sensor kinase
MLMERDQITSLINAMVVEQAEVIVVAVDAQGGILFLNPGAAEMFEITEGANIGQPFSNLLGEAVPEELVSEKPVRYRFAGSDGEERWMRGFWSRPDGADNVRVYVAKDFTRDYFLQRDLVRSAALAELGLMAAEVAHEVNNPATYLMTNLSILRDDLAVESVDSTSAGELIDECLDGVQRIVEVVRRMRTLATSGNEENVSELVDLSSVVRDACRIAGLRVKYKADLHIHDECTVQVLGSPKRLGQVVLNLVVNAADALTGQADPMPRIDVSVGEKDGWGWVEVRDNGPGIPDHKAQSIFEPFVTSKIGKGGTGLGLAVSQTIAEEHGGTLMLEPHDGLGAWFQMRLPLA